MSDDAKSDKGAKVDNSAKVDKDAKIDKDAEVDKDAKVDRVQGSKDELLALLAEFDTAMLVGVEADGTLRARPMGLQQQRLPDCDLWFVTADDTHKTEEIERNQQVNICCLRTRDRAYVS